MEHSDTGERLVREPECRMRSGLSRATRYRMELAGQFPRRRRITGRVSGWLDSELTAWLRACPAGVADAPTVALQVLADRRAA